MWPILIYTAVGAAFGAFAGFMETRSKAAQRAYIAELEAYEKKLAGTVERAEARGRVSVVKDPPKDPATKDPQRTNAT